VPEFHKKKTIRYASLCRLLGGFPMTTIQFKATPEMLVPLILKKGMKIE
jgi:hypothetical protein